MNKRFFELAVLTLFVCFAASCDKDENEINETEENWTLYTTANGLPDNTIHSIATDASDNIWVGTDMGVSSYDGDRWVNYVNFINSSVVTAIAIDTNGDKWFGTLGGGVAKLSGSFWEYFQAGSNSPNSLKSNNISSIAIDSQGNKWFGTSDAGVFVFDGTNWKNYTVEDGLVNNNVNIIKIDENGNKWFGTNGGVSIFNGETWTSYSYTGDKSNGLAGNGVNAILIDDEGNKWFGTFGGLSKYTDNNWTYYEKETQWLEAGSPVLSLGMDQKAVKWFGSNGLGISKFDGRNWTTYSKINSANISAVNVIATDKQGNKWFGTASGLIKLED